MQIAPAMPIQIPNNGEQLHPQWVLIDQMGISIKNTSCPWLVQHKPSHRAIIQPIFYCVRIATADLVSLKRTHFGLTPSSTCYWYVLLGWLRLFWYKLELCIYRSIYRVTSQYIWTTSALLDCFALLHGLTVIGRGEYCLFNLRILTHNSSAWIKQVLNTAYATRSSSTF